MRNVTCITYTKKKNWLLNFALEAETAITRPPVLDCEYYRKQVAEHVETLYTRDTLHSTHNTHSKMKILNLIKTKLKKNEAMITKADKRNSIVTLPTQYFNKKINNFISENHVQTINIDPTNTFQNHIRKTINQ